MAQSSSRGRMTKLTPAQQRKLEKAARTTAKHSYSPYSQFPVGAAVLADSGKIYVGTNVENASYGLCNCAERTAIFSAIAAGERPLSCVVVYTPTQTATPPCGACRQVINEFGPRSRSSPYAIPMTASKPPSTPCSPPLSVRKIWTDHAGKSQEIGKLRVSYEVAFKDSPMVRR